jgi:hypothetical protein
VIISHAHPGEVGGAKLMQDRFGSKIVIGEGDWEDIEKSVNLFPHGRPKRDIAVTDVQKITLGGRTVTIIPMPGHTPGTLSMIFDVKDNGTPRTVAFSGGTEFNFINDVPHFDTYIASARKFAAAAAQAGATILMTNQSEFDNAAAKIRMLASRRPGERIRSTSAPTRCSAISKCSTNAPKWRASSCSGNMESRSDARGRETFQLILAASALGHGRKTNYVCGDGSFPRKQPLRPFCTMRA